LTDSSKLEFTWKIIAAFVMPPRRPNNKASTQRAVPQALLDAFRELDESDLRLELKNICEVYPEVNTFLQGRLLVQGKDVVRYHANSESEDEGFPSESESETSEGPEEIIAKGGVVISDDDFTARTAKCENCNERFDVTENERGDCLWHSGIHLSHILLEAICLLTIFQERKNSSTTLTFGMISRSIGAIRKISQTTMITAKASNGVVVEEKEKMKGAKSRSINRSQTALFLCHFQDRPRKKERPRKYFQAPGNKKAPRAFLCLTRLTNWSDKKKIAAYHPGMLSDSSFLRNHKHGTGKKVIDMEAEFWTVNDIDDWKNLNEFANDDMFAECFIWTCYDARSDAPGCTETLS
jgi:hypothetical protein